jgi:hypothetical protein
MDQRHQLNFIFHGDFGLTFYLSEKANALLIAWETISHHMICSTKTINAGWRLDLKSCNNPSEKIRPRELQKLVNSLKLTKVCAIDGIPNECLRRLPRTLVHLTHLTNHCLWNFLFLTPCKDAKIITLPNSCKDSTFSQNLRRLASRLRRARYLRKF